MIKKILLSLACLFIWVSASPAISAQSNTSTTTATQTNPFALLILGIDSGGLGRTETGRSDVIILATINPTTQAISLTSLPRDSYVDIPGYGMDKLNHAYAYGGADLSLATIERLFDIDIAHYVTIDMSGVEAVVDALGGITVTPPSSFSISGYTFEAGVPTELTGAMALAYARERYTSGGDYARQARQREIISAVLAKSSQIDALKQLQPLLSASSNSIKTDLPISQILSLIAQLKQGQVTVETYQVDGNGQMIDGVYYEQLSPDSFAAAQTAIKQHLAQ